MSIIGPSSNDSSLEWLVDRHRFFVFENEIYQAWTAKVRKNLTAILLTQPSHPINPERGEISRLEATIHWEIKGHRNYRNKFLLPWAYQWNYQYPIRYQRWSSATWPTSIQDLFLFAVWSPVLVSNLAANNQRPDPTRFCQRCQPIYPCICRPFYRLPIVSLYSRRRRTRIHGSGAKSQLPTVRSTFRVQGWTPKQNGCLPQRYSAACKHTSSVVYADATSLCVSFFLM